MKNDLLELQVQVLQLACMWPKNPFGPLAFRLNFWFVLILLTVGTCGLLVKSAVTDDLVDRSEAIDIFTLTLSASFKLVVFIVRHEELSWLVNKAKELGDYVPPGWMKLNKNLTYIHCSAGCFAIFLWAMSPLLKYVFEDDSKINLPLNIYLPYEMKNFMFGTVYILSFFCLEYSALIYMAADTYLFTIIYIANGALRTLSQSLLLMTNDARNYKLTVQSEAELEQWKFERIKEYIRIHAEVLKFLRKIDDVFRSMILADILHAIISLSFAMLQTSESKGFFEWCKMLVFVGYCFIHQYLNSHFGQQLINEQDDLHHATITGIPWEGGSLKVMKAVQIMSTGTMIPIRLSAWKMYSLQFATFLEFVKSMISYFMVLRTLQDGSSA